MGTTGQSITLANSIIGVGILAMPFCFQQCGVLLASLILLSMGLISRLCCYFLLKSAIIARKRNFEFLAFHVFGPAGKTAVELGIIGFLMGTCIAYFVVVGDLGPQIIAKIFNINQSDILRTLIMVMVSLVCVLPLGLLRNVDSLSNVSAATIGFYFCLVMKLIAEATSQLLAGDWQTRVEMWKPSGVLQCVPIFSMALFCQTQLFEIFETLPSLSLEKMNIVTKNAINICSAVYFTLGTFGYIAFCDQNISGNILMSISPTMGSDVIKLGFVMSVAFSFPLIIFPCRASLYSFLYKKVHTSHHDHIINHSIPESTFRCITVGIIAVALFVSLLIPNIELVLGLVGSTIGVMICVVFPAACFVNVTFKDTNERILAKAILILGLIIMVLGTYANLQAVENNENKYDDRYITQERIDKIVEDFFESQKSEDIMKSITKKDPNQQKNGNDNPKNSEFQPPNPEPPETQNVENKLKQIDSSPQISESKKKVVISEPHPKDLTGKLESVHDEEKIDRNDHVKEDKSQHADEEKENNDMIKQQQLIETIKQHGEEQKELMKEQIEILDELKKTKQELKQNQKDEDRNEAKKIAVESIKKIANIAIQSLGGVTEKTIGIKTPESIEKIANNVVQQIKDVQNPVIKHMINNSLDDKQPKNSKQILISKQENQMYLNKHSSQNTSGIAVVNNEDKNINGKLMVSNNLLRNGVQSKSAENKKNKKENSKKSNEHIRSLKEPQSNKDEKNLKKIAQFNGIERNLPLPLMINNSFNGNSQIAKSNKEIKRNNEFIDNLSDANNIAVIRQKREVVDCTDESSLKPEDRYICKTLVDFSESKKESQTILIPQLDFNGLPKSLPIETNVIHHIRSLKSYNEEKNR